MKLKKILASLTATAMAVSVMAFTPAVSRNLTVNAADENVIFSGNTRIVNYNTDSTNCTLSTNSFSGQDFYNYEYLAITACFNSDDQADLYNDSTDNKYKAQQVATIKLVTNEAYNSAWLSTDLYASFNAYSETVEADQDITFKISTEEILLSLSSNEGFDAKTMSDYIIVQTGWVSGVTIKKVAFSESKDTTVYSEKSYIATSIEGDNKNVYKFEGTWNNANVSGPKAALILNATSTDGMGFNLDTIDGKSIAENVWVNSGSTYTIPLSKIPSCDGIVFTTWGNGSIDESSYSVTGITIKNDSTKSAVYTSINDTPEVEDSLSFTASNISLNVGDGPAKNKLAFKSGRTDFKPEFNIVGNATKVEVGDNNTLIISPVSAGVTTITAKVTIPDTADSAGGSYTASCMVIVSEKSDSEILWSGSADQGTKWDWNPADISADNCNFKSGDKLVINFTVNGDADYHQLKIMDGSGDHNVLTSPAVSEWGTVDVTSSPYSIELNAADIANVNANGITITGYDVTITSVEKVSDSSSEDTSTEVIVESPAGITATVDQSELIDAVGLTPEEIAAGTKIVLNIESETRVSESDKAVIEDSVSEENDQKIELILEININKVSGNNNNVIHNLAKAIPITIDIPNYDPNKEYFIIHVKDDGTSERIDGTVSNGKFTFYAKSFSPYAIISQPRSNPPAAVTSHRISIGSSHVYTNAASAAPGTAVRVFTDFGFDARVYAGNNLIASLRSGGTFTMPASDVRIVAVANMDGALLLNAKPVSYIFVYDTDMNEITVSSSRKSKTDGEITVKLGAKYAGKTVTLYSGKKDTTNMITSETADKNGNVTFSVDLGENYTAVVE